MPSNDPALTLNNLSYQVLGVLSRAPQSGYDIVKQLENFRPAKTSQVYPTLARLEAAGLLTAQDVEQTGRPNKKIYSVTAEGNAALVRWIGSDPEPPYQRDDFLTMVYSGWLVDRPALLTLFLAREARLRAQIRQVRADLAALMAHHPAEIDDPANWRFCRHVLQTRRMMVAQTELLWCQSMIERLKDKDDD